MAGTVLIDDFGFLPGVFTELNPYDLPITTLLMARGVTLLPNKDYTYTYHMNPDHTNPTLTLQRDLGTTNFGSTGYTHGSNVIQVWDEGAGVSYFRMGEQQLTRTLGWQGPSNASREEDPMARGMREAMDRVKYQLEKVAREGVYRSALNNGGTAEPQQRGYRFAPGITNVAVGVAGGSAVGSLATLTLTKLVDTLQTLWENKVNGSDRLTFISNAIPRRQITDIMRDQFNAGKNSLSRVDAGVSIQSFLTDFGEVDVVLTHTMPVDQAYILNLSQMRAVGHAVPGRGFMFEEALPTQQAGVFRRFYTEVGIDHGVGSCHARLYGIGSVAGHKTSGTVESR
jgi:hypothetical protein